MLIHLKNDLTEIERLTQQVERFGEEHDLAPKVVFDLQLALEEVFTNIVSYGYEDDQVHEVHVEIAVQDGTVTVRVEDDGRPFDPLQKPPPDVTAPLEERAVGGLGIYLVRKLMDSAEYRREGGRNILLLSKKSPVA